MPHPDKSVPGLATNERVYDKSRTNPLVKTTHGFVYNILTRQDVVESRTAPVQVDKSV